MKDSTISFRASKKLVHDITEVAQEEERSVSSMIVIILGDYLKEREGGHDDPHVIYIDDKLHVGCPDECGYKTEGGCPFRDGLLGACPLVKAQRKKGPE